MIELDATDRKILNLLQNDGRISNADLAERINLSPSACLRRVKRLEDEGVIDRYVMLINQQAINKSSSVFVEITLNSQSEEALAAFEEALLDIPDVLVCFLMAGDYDYIMRVAVSGPEDYERLHKSYLSRLPGVARIRSSFALRNVCQRTGFEL